MYQLLDNLTLSERGIFYDRKFFLLHVEYILYDRTTEYAFQGLSKRKADITKCTHHIGFIPVYFFMDDIRSSLCRK